MKTKILTHRAPNGPVNLMFMAFRSTSVPQVHLPFPADGESISANHFTTGNHLNPLES